jgi:hypothetical protein
VKVPQDLKDVGVLLEALTVVDKGIAQAYEFSAACACGARDGPP